MDEIERVFANVMDSSTITISANLPFLKTIFAGLLVKHASSLGIEVDYFDLDLQFSSLFHNVSSERFGIGEGNIIQPNPDSFGGEILSFLSQRTPNTGGLIFLDSINSFQQIFRASDPTHSSMTANHEAAVYITVIQQFAHKYSKSLLMTNVSRARPRTLDGRVKWDREPVGGRVILSKSDLVITLTDLPNESITSSRADSRCFAASVLTLGSRRENQDSFQFYVPDFFNEKKDV